MPFNKILVPCDFLPGSSTALLHAAHLAEKLDGEILLLHLTSSAEEIESAMEKMKALHDDLKKHFKGNVLTMVKEGDIMHMGRIANQEHCSMVIMPTHGMKGMQEIMGSLALMVVSESRTPFIIVQERPIMDQGYKRIVIPMDLRKELLDEIDLFVRVAQLFSSEVFLVSHSRSPHGNDSGMLAELNERFTIAGVEVNMHSIAKFDFSKAVAEYAQSIDADLICAINFAQETLYGLNPRTDEEDFIYNKAGISVMLVTPEEKEERVSESLED